MVYLGDGTPTLDVDEELAGPNVDDAGVCNAVDDAADAVVDVTTAAAALPVLGRLVVVDAVSRAACKLDKTNGLFVCGAQCK